MISEKNSLIGNINIPSSSGKVVLPEGMALMFSDNVMSDGKKVSNETISILNSIDTKNLLMLDGFFNGCTEITTIPAIDTSFAVTFNGMFNDCTSLVTVPILNTSRATAMSDMFQNCPNLSDESLNNILQMCIDTGWDGSNPSLSNLKYIGLSSSQRERCKSLSNYQAFINAGWQLIPYENLI